MQIKSFYIRLSAAHLHKDQERLNEFLKEVNVIHSNTHLFEGSIHCWSVIVMYEEKAQKISTPQKSESPTTTPVLTYPPDAEKRIYLLKRWRSQKAQELEIPPFMVFHNAVIEELAQKDIQNISDLLTVRGFGEKKVEQFGQDIVRLLQRAS